MAEPTSTSTAPVSSSIAPEAASTAPVAAPATPATAPAAAAAAPEVPKADPTKPAPTQAEVRKLKLKLEGADVELSESEVIALAQQSGVAQKRFMEAAAMRKQAEQVLEFIHSNPKEALSRLGVDLRKFSEETLTEIIKREQESPEQKKIRETEEKLRAYEAKEKEEAEAAKQKEQQEKEAAAKRIEEEKQAATIKKYDDLFTEALAKIDLPKNAYTVTRMAQLARIQLKKGVQVDANIIAKLVKEDYAEEFKTQTAGKDGDALMAMLGPEIIKLITKAQIAKLKTKPQKFVTETAQPVAEAPKQPGRWRDLQLKNRRLRG